MQSFEYLRPSCVAEITCLLEAHGSSALVLCGGTDLTVGLRHGKLAPQVVIDIKQADDLPPTITEEGGVLTISATSVFTKILEHELVRLHFPALVEAAAEVGSIQVRNRATLVGNICNASPAADTVPVLAMHGAAVTVRGPGGIRKIPVTDFIEGNRKTALARGEFVTAVNLPIPQKPLGTAFARMTRRRGVDLATVNIGCSIDDCGITTFALGAVSPRPMLVQDRTGVLADIRKSPKVRDEILKTLLSPAAPITDVRASADYRLAMLSVLAQRSHQKARERLSKCMSNV